jgi:hypothetical protein
VQSAGRPDDAPRYRRVARYATFVEAEQAANHLRENGVAAQHVTIVRHGLSVRAGSGRLMGWLAASRDAVVGAVLGGILGWLLDFVRLLDPAVGYAVLSGTTIGALVGALWGYARYRIGASRAEITRASGVEADSYQVHVDARYTDPKPVEMRLARFWPV